MKQAQSGIAGLLRLDGTAADREDAIAVGAMASAIAHRGLASCHVRQDGPLAIAWPGAGPGGASPVRSLQPGGPGGGFLLPGGSARRSAEGFTLAIADGTAVGSPDLLRLHREHGDTFPAHVRGAVAIALWDPARETLLLARDRAGVRPLFTFRPRHGLLLFASEVKALLAHPDGPRDLDWVDALGRFATPFRDRPQTGWFRGVAPVPPGAVVHADARRGSVEARPYWTLRFTPEEEPSAGGVGEGFPLPGHESSAAQGARDTRSEREIIDGLRSALGAAVEDGFAGGARAGLFLSGGVDSIAIAALGRAHAPETFTVLSRSTLGNGDAPLAHDAAQHLGLANAQVVFRRDAARYTAGRWRELVWVCETPIVGPQHFLKSELCRAARERSADLRVLLTGEGGDEVCGVDPAAPAPGEEEEVPDFETVLERFARNRREDLHTVDTLGVEVGIGGRRVFSDAFLAANVGQRLTTSPMRRRLLECLASLPDDTLWRDDRIAARHGLEARAPFLDHRLLEFVAAIPPAALPALLWRKRILRDALAQDLPDRLRLQRKVAFWGGVDARFTERMLLDAALADGGALVREALGDGGKHPVLAPGFVDGLLHDAARDPQGIAIQPLLLLVNMGLLEGMARDAAAAARRAPSAAPPPIVLDRWEEGRIAEMLADPARGIDVERPLALAPGVELARPVAGEDVLWIVVRDEVRYVLDGDDTKGWREVLVRIEGERPLRAVLEEAKVSLEDVRKHLEEALEFEVVAIIEND